jgi:hypothetical protein
MAKAGTGFSAVIEKITGKWGYHFISVPNAVAKQFTDTRAKRVFCIINDTLEFACAIRPDGDGGFFINVNTTRMQKAKLKVGQKVKATVRIDKTKFGYKMPAELQAILDTDEEAKKYWDGVRNSHQRQMIYYIDSAKSVEKRIERSFLFVNRMKNTKGAWPEKQKTY